MCVCIVHVTQLMNARVCVGVRTVTKSQCMCVYLLHSESVFGPAVMHTGVFSPIVCVLRRVFVCICWNVNRFIFYLQLYPICTLLFVYANVPHLLYSVLFLNTRSNLHV